MGKLGQLVDEAKPVAVEDEPDADVKLDEETGLPEGIPITPLGRYGLDFAYLNDSGHFIRLSARDHSRNNLAAMFGAQQFQLRKYWPRRTEIIEKDDEGKKTGSHWVVTGFKADETADALFLACSMLPTFKDATDVRGPGAWPDENGDLIFHCGNALWTKDGEIPLGRLGGKIYAADVSIPVPYERVVPETDGPGFKIKSQLETWNWQRGEMDAHLALGWIAASMVGGALDKWRPSIFVTGDAGTGKSTMIDLVKAIMGGELVTAGDATEAGLSQAIGQSSLPCVLDEFEAEAGDVKSKAILKLMRLAASGEVKIRGSQDHKAVRFNARSCFFFTAILMPAMSSAERQRLAILRLDKLRVRRELDLTPATWAIEGRKLKRRFVDQWHRFTETLEAYQVALSKVGHSSRGCDQFGTLLACADIALYDGAVDLDRCEQWARDLDPTTLSETIDDVSNADQCLAHLATAVPDIWKGGTRMMVSQIVKEVDHAEGAVHKANLATYGLAVIKPRGGDIRYLAVANSHRGTQLLFSGSDWEGRTGMSGPWMEALRRLDGARTGFARFGPTNGRCTLIPLDIVVPDHNNPVDANEFEIDPPRPGQRVDEEVE